MKENGSYQFENLERKEHEANLLKERASMRLDSFPDLLKKHGMNDNFKVLEIGTAQGIRAQIIADAYPNSLVTAIDRSPELIQKNTSKKNLEFQVGDVYDLPYENNEFDFVYARLVFMHLSDPILALKNCLRVLKPGGRILIEDADRDCMFFEPEPKSFPNFWQKVQEGQRRLGGDPNIGRKLAPLFKSLGFTNLNIEIQTILGTGPDIEFLSRTLMHSLNLYLDHVDRPQGEIAIQDLLHLSKDPIASFYHFWFAISAAKPPR